jgi:aspartyl protease family protein
MNVPKLNSHHNYRLSVREKIGRWMIYSAWLLILLLLTGLFSNWLDYRQNPNRSLQVKPDINGNVSIILQRNRSGHYVAPGLINDQPVLFLLDTGASHVALPADLADQIGLKREAMMSSLTANGLVRSWMTKLDQVELGPFVMHDVQASIMPSMPTKEVLLGMNFLKHLELVQKGNQMIIRAPSLN